MTTTQQQQPPAAPLVGVVQRVNGKGFTLAGHEGWINISRFARPEEAPIPTVGQMVAVVLDKAGFARKIAVAPTTTPAPTAPTTNGNGSSPTTTAAGDAATPATSSPTKDTQIARMNAVTNAVAILSSGGRGCELEDVLAVAEVLENWVTR